VHVNGRRAHANIYSVRAYNDDDDDDDDDDDVGEE
jgi:hypothetical protein